MSLECLLNPASVAVIGASQNPDKIGGRPIRFMREQSYKGRIYPINPARSEIQGLKAYPSVAALPEAPEAVIIAVAGLAEVPAAVEACAARGVKVCVIMSSGFGEAGEAGRAAEARLLSLARAAGMRLIGPNSQGVANFNTGAILNFSTMFVEEPPAPGPVAIISQSGAMSVVPYGLLRARGIGVGHCHATGNDADITVAELAAEVVQDPAVRLCLLYLETLRDPEMLALAAARARARGVPLIALKSGRSAEGARAAASHTGAIASEDRVIDAFFARHGIWRAEGTADLVHAAELYLKDWTPAGDRVGIVSNSGATCVLSADAVERHGLRMAQFQDDTVAGIAAALPAFAASRNPVDLTAALLSDSGLFGKVLPQAGRDPGVDMLMIGIPVSGKGYDFPRFARDTADFAQSGLPVVMAAPQLCVRQAFSAAGIPTFETEDGAIRALAQFQAHHALMARAPGGSPTPVSGLGAGPGRLLSEEEAMDLLAAEGADLPARAVCADVAAAQGFLAARQGRGAIVLKAHSAQIPHKSDHGLVRLNLHDPAEVAAHFDDIRRRVQAMGLPFEGVLAAEMLPQGLEMVVGGHVDPVFGPVIIVGAGGIAVEAMPDNRLLLAGFTDAEFDEALDGLRLAPLLRGIRGGSALNRTAIRAAARIIEALLCSGEVQSADLNPLLVTPDRAVAADALLQVPA